MSSTDLKSSRPQARGGAWHGTAVGVGWLLLLMAFVALDISDPRVRPIDLLLFRMGLAVPAFLLLMVAFVRGAGPPRIVALLGIALFAFIALCSLGVL
jgi:hypothetical protein